ncbi:uncharacterized protein LOC132953151 [Metopolophium dirhodum]|uniref:uncharacterized protein LOC132953151 n=1 Tax=Metopolophium dirhodum TaxID=44670 RepID=UPI0029907C68|nr:uncharacterized protein LOC132953151 [Metopolophium dirhodum]
MDPSENKKIYKSRKPSNKKNQSSRMRCLFGIRNQNKHNPEVIEPVGEPFFLGADNRPPCSSRETIRYNPEVIEPIVEPFFLGADNQPPCSSRETISEITNSRDIEINDLGIEETLHDLVAEKSISSNRNIEYQSSGRRIVDINYVFYQIKNSNHQGPFDCSFLNMTFISEKKHGFRSTFKFKCDVCNIITFIDSEKSKPETYLPINEASVSGSISAGIGYTQLSELCATMDVPCMASCTYLLVQEFINKRIHDVVEAQMKIAGEEERRLAIEAGSVDIDGIPMCTVVADGQWSKRSYKTKYDALSGVATIIGYRSRKILFVGIRNRFCVICQRAKNKKIHPLEHTCFLNWTKGATSMEADGIADGFKQSLDMHGLKYNKLIGDGDSSVTKRLADIMPYGPRLQVIKIECRNHLLRNYGTKLRAMTLNTKFPISLRNHIKSNILRFRFSITKAIEYHNSLLDQTDYQKSVGKLIIQIYYFFF